MENWSICVNVSMLTEIYIEALLVDQEWDIRDALKKGRGKKTVQCRHRRFLVKQAGPSVSSVSEWFEAQKPPKQPIQMIEPKAKTIRGFNRLYDGLDVG